MRESASALRSRYMSVLHEGCGRFTFPIYVCRKTFPSFPHFGLSQTAMQNTDHPITVTRSDDEDDLDRTAARSEAFTPIVPSLRDRLKFADLSRAPKCFGSPILCEPHGRHCDVCPLSESCTEVAELLLADYLVARAARHGVSTDYHGTEPWQRDMFAAFRGFYIRAERASRDRNNRQTVDRRRAKAALVETEIEREFERRLRHLSLDVKHRRADKRLQQLRGREGYFALIWKVDALERHKLGRSPTNAELAAAVLSAPGAPADFNRDKAQTARKRIRDLEEPGQPWADFTRRAKAAA